MPEQPPDQDPEGDPPGGPRQGRAALISIPGARRRSCSDTFEVTCTMAQADETGRVPGET